MTKARITYYMKLLPIVIVVIAMGIIIVTLLKSFSANYSVERFLQRDSKTVLVCASSIVMTIAIDTYLIKS